MICFISGGITNVPDYLDKFRVAAGQLKSLGFEPFDPAALSKPILDDGVQMPDDKWLEIDFAAIKNCDALYHLDNWVSSSGAKKEHAFAQAYGIPIFYQENYEVYKAMGLNPNELIGVVKAGGISNAT